MYTCKKYQKQLFLYIFSFVFDFVFLKMFKGYY